MKPELNEPNEPWASICAWSGMEARFVCAPDVRPGFTVGEETPPLHPHIGGIEEPFDVDKPGPWGYNLVPGCQISSLRSQITGLCPSGGNP